METIKFRAWNKYYKEMHSHENLLEKSSASATRETRPKHFVTETTNLLVAILSSKELQKRYELMQFTGLHDINGKEVYCGDIYKNLDNELIGVFSIRNGVGGYYLHCKEYKEQKVYNCLPFAELDTTNFEVIGNIHENSELLNID